MSNTFSARVLVSLMFVTSLVSCKGKQVEYVYHEQWKIPNIYDPTLLKGKPVEVKESFFDNVDDTSFDAPGHESYYMIYRFDNSGHVTFTKYSFGVGFSEVNNQYGSDGPEYQAISYDSATDPNPKSISGKASERLSNNSFKVTHLRQGQYQNHFIVDFSRDGQVVKEAGWIKDIPAGTTIKYYADENLMKEVTISQKSKSEIKYYYSDKGCLDSVVYFNDDRLSGRAVYENNEHGDAVLYVKTDQGSIEKKLRMKYQYDEKGNWIKQLTFTEVDNSVLKRAIQGQKFPGYALCVREINY